MSNFDGDQIAASDCSERTFAFESDWFSIVIINVFKWSGWFQLFTIIDFSFDDRIDNGVAINKLAVQLLSLYIDFPASLICMCALSVGQTSD